MYSVSRGKAMLRLVGTGFRCFRLYPLPHGGLFIQHIHDTGVNAKGVELVLQERMRSMFRFAGHQVSRQSRLGLLAQ